MSRLPSLTATPRRAGAALAAVLTVTALAACAPSSSAGGSASGSASAAGSGSASASGAASCTKDQLKVRTAGKLTLGTDNPVYEPWFKDNKPASGEGYESAVAYAVAEKLGFAKADVTWVTASFTSAYAPGPKNFDFDINEVSITDERKKAVDFSSGYYDVTQAVVTVKGSSIAGAKSIADLAKAKLGAQVGTTSYKTITDVIKPTAKPAVFNTNDDAKLALANKQIDGLVLDLPTARYETSGADEALKDPVLIGRLENTSGTTEQFGLVLDLGSPLTPCVTRAVDDLRADGTLKKLEQTWLADFASAPVIK